MGEFSARECEAIRRRQAEVFRGADRDPTPPPSRKPTMRAAQPVDPYAELAAFIAVAHDLHLL
jgi:hypothetical protein